MQHFWEILYPQIFLLYNTRSNNYALPSGFKHYISVLHELTPVARRWKSIGTALGLKPDLLEEIQAENSNDPLACLSWMVMTWLRRNYNVRRFGEPTWQSLAGTVGQPEGGANTTLARTIAGKRNAGGMLRGVSQ